MRLCVLKVRSYYQPFNLHAGKWFEGPWRRVPCKIYPIFSGWRKHLRFCRVATWEKAGFHKVNQEKNVCHALKNLRCFCHPEKNRVYFIGYPSNDFSGCRLNGWMSYVYIVQKTKGLKKFFACIFEDHWQRYTCRVLQTIQMRLILLCIWAEGAILDSAKTALKFK